MYVYNCEIECKSIKNSGSHKKTVLLSNLHLFHYLIFRHFKIIFCKISAAAFLKLLGTTRAFF